MKHYIVNQKIKLDEEGDLSLSLSVSCARSTRHRAEIATVWAMVHSAETAQGLLALFDWIVIPRKSLPGSPCSRTSHQGILRVAPLGIGPFDASCLWL